MKRKPWWRRKKFLSTIVGLVVGLFGHKLGLDPETARSVAIGAGGYVAYETSQDYLEVSRAFTDKAKDIGAALGIGKHRKSQDEQ